MLRAELGACFRFILVIAYFVSNAAYSALWKVNVDEKEGLPVISRGGAPALSSKFAFWRKDWAFADQHVEFKVVAPFEYSVVGTNRALNLDLSGLIRKLSNRELVWEFHLNARNTTLDAIGGGITFKFDLGTVGSELGEPELLSGNRGWTWGRRGGSRVEMRFDPPLASVYFERGRKSEVRAMFYRGKVPQGRMDQSAALSVSGDMAIDPSASERFGLDDIRMWPSVIRDWKTSPVDLSFLNTPEKPAGKHGFLQAVKGKLAFEDGTAVRFWGTNLTSYTLFGTSRENTRLQARRLSELGFNLVRLHHHDSPWVNPNIFGDRKSSDTQNLSSVMLDKLDWWIKCLKDEGIYVWLDLHVGRQLSAGDKIERFEEISRGNSVSGLQGYSYVNASIQQAMQRFNEAYVTHGNSYTGLRYKDDPAIVAMLITNENDVTNHFGNALLPDKNVPWHSALYMAQAEAFAAKHGLPKDKVWRSWDHGPSKLFLNDLEHRFNTETIQHLRSLGVKVPIVTTSTWGFNPLSSLPALTAGNIIDVHSYGGFGDLEKNPVYGPNLVHWIAAAQVAGQPLSVTEWNVSPFPAPDRHTVPLYVAASASLQGWDALMQYAYSQVPLNAAGSPSNWHAFNDPALLATLPAAALLYRQGHVKQARTIYAFAPSANTLFNQAVSPDNSVALRTAAEMGRLVVVMPRTKELPWLEQGKIPEGAIVIGNPKQSLLDAGASEVVSDTGQLTRNWEQGFFVINSPMTQAAMGWIGGKNFRLTDVEIMAATRNATVAVQSLDENPIGSSGRIMISLGARALPKAGNQLPFYSEPVTGRLSIQAPAGLRLYKKAVSSGEIRQIAAPYIDGRYLITLDDSLGAHWLFLR